MLRRPEGEEKPSPIFGGEKQEKHCAGLKALHSVVLTLTQEIYTLDIERRVVYNVSQVQDEILLCRRVFRLRRLWEVAPPHSRRVNLVFPKINNNILLYTHPSGCVFVLL